MVLDNMRGSYYGRCPPILVGALFIICLILMFNWWSLTAQNYDLIRQLDDLSEQLKISSEEQDRCARQRSSFESQIKALEEETAQLRVKLEQQRTDNDEYKKQLAAKDDEVKSALKTKDDCESSVTRCTTELESLKKLDISKDGVIASLRIEKDRLKSEIDNFKPTVDKLKEQLHQARLNGQAEKLRVETKPLQNAQAKNTEVPTASKGVANSQTPKPPLEMADNDDNNAAERSDEVNGENEDPPVGPQDEQMEIPNDDDVGAKKTIADLDPPLIVK